MIFVHTDNEMVRILFKIKKFETKTHEFDGTFTTDEVSIVCKSHSRQVFTRMTDLHKYRPNLTTMNTKN